MQIAEVQYLRDSPEQFIKRIFDYKTAEPHLRILEHYEQYQQTLDLAPRGCGKTRIGDIGYSAWKAVNNPNIRILIVSDTDTHAVRFLGTIKAVIESHPLIKRYYGDVKGDKWTDHEIVLKTRTDKTLTEATISAMGMYSGAVTTGHYDIIIADDLINFDNARTEGQRERSKEWFKTTLLPTLLPGGEIHCLGCLPKSTKILTGDNTWKNIETICKGEKVYTFDKGKLTTQYVEETIPQGTDEILEIITERSKIKANGIHPFLIIEPISEKKFPSRRYNHIYDFTFTWKIASELKPNDMLVTIKEIDAGNTIDTSDFAWLFGFMVGDGWIVQNSRTNGKSDKIYTTWKICFAKGQYHSLNEKVVRLFKSLFNIDLRLNVSSRVYMGTSKKVGEKLKDLGLKHGAKNKDIPTWIFKTSLKNRIAFIHGLLSADGWQQHKDKKRKAKRKKHPSFFGIESSSKKLIDDLQLLCRISGVLTSNIYYRTRISQPPNSPKPIRSETWHLNLTFNKAYGMYRLKGEAKKKFPYKNFRFETIQEIKSVGREEVWDLAVEKTHNFIAEGFVTHNTRYHYNDLWEMVTDELGYDTQIQQAIKKDGTSIWEMHMPLNDRIEDGRKTEGLETIRATLGSTIFNLQYMNDVELMRQGGKMFKRNWFEIVTSTPAGDQARFWDMASTEDKAGSDPDWTIGGLMLENNGVFYIKDIVRFRHSPATTEAIIKQTAQIDGYDIPIYMEQEPGSGGPITIDHYARNILRGYAFRGVPSTSSKVARAQPFSAASENGNVKILRAAWTADVLSELVLFPHGPHDDIVDALSGAFKALTQEKAEAPSATPYPALSINAPSRRY